ncbi:MAG: DUF1775 domain-containing protein [Comamonadaceae bacterium]|nr:DUF1775 domain-containing protein [Comamonadaceae bacterium]
MLPLAALGQTPAGDAPSDVPVKSLGMVIINSGQPTSLPTQIPTTMEGVTREQLAQTINATDSEDALKYLPSLLVRKRYIGDYNHAILSSRASGTGNSARSAVYADGILLSNYLGNGVGGLSFPPRWGLVTPEEIERVDVMYGPFSAAYPGNSVGAVVDYVTRMPTKFEAHAGISHVSQPFELYGTRSTYTASQASASLGNKSGGWSWFINASHTDSEGQPLTFATRVVATGTPGNAGTAVAGTVPGLNNANVPWDVLGYRTLNNADVNGATYQGVSKYFTTDLRLRWQVSKIVAATSGISVQIPTGFQGAKPYPKAGWTLATTLGKLAKPYDSHGKPVSEDVTVVSWTAASKDAALQDAHFDEFMLRGKLPETAGLLWFKVLQTCESGSNDWSETPVSGSSAKGLKSPAVLLEVTAQDAAVAPSAPATVHAPGAHQH